MIVSNKGCRNNCSREERVSGNCNCQNSISKSIDKVKGKAAVMIVNKKRTSNK